MTKSAIDSLIFKPSVTEDLVLQMSGLALGESAPGPKKGKARAVPKRAHIKSRVPQKAPAIQQIDELMLTDVIPLNNMKGDLLRLSAFADVSQGSLEAAASQLNNASTLIFRQQEAVVQGLLNAQLNLRRGLQQLVGDPIYSVIPESTICCPAAMVSDEPRILPKSPPQKSSRSAKNPPSKVASKKVIPRDKATADNHSQHLPLAQKYLSDIYKVAKKYSSTSTVHTITETLGKILTMLSALPSAQAKGSCSSHFIAYILGKSSITGDSHRSCTDSDPKNLEGRQRCSESL